MNIKNTTNSIEHDIFVNEFTLLSINEKMAYLNDFCHNLNSIHNILKMDFKRAEREYTEGLFQSNRIKQEMNLHKLKEEYQLYSYIENKYFKNFSFRPNKKNEKLIPEIEKKIIDFSDEYFKIKHKFSEKTQFFIENNFFDNVARNYSRKHNFQDSSNLSKILSILNKDDDKKIPKKTLKCKNTN